MKPAVLAMDNGQQFLPHWLAFSTGPPKLAQRSSDSAPDEPIWNRKLNYAKHVPFFLIKDDLNATLKKLKL